MNRQDLKKVKLPGSSGVYIFKKNEDILYVGKATSLKDRVKSYFNPDLITTRGPLLVDMVYLANKVEYIKTDSVLEAIILEASLIKRFQPKFNTKEKDDKSFNYIFITKESYPRVLIERKKNVDFDAKKILTLNYTFSTYFGPFTNSTQLKEALKIVRKIFPFRDKCEIDQRRPCFNYQIGLCPGVCVGAISEKDYKNIIKNIKLFFEGKKIQIIKSLEKDMKVFAIDGEFEKAGKVKIKIFALKHIQDVALIKSESFDGTSFRQKNSLRIEAYDAAHLSGTNNVGVMVVMEGNEFKKSDYRKFIIRDSKGNDIAALKEMLERRLRHAEWRTPDLIVLDGGIAQLNIAKTIAGNIPVVAVTKDDRHKAKALIGDELFIKNSKNEILHINSEAHRFAIKYHRSKRVIM